DPIAVGVDSHTGLVRRELGAGDGRQLVEDERVRLADVLSVPLVAYRMGVDLVPDDDADWRERHGIAAGGAVLVRPDGFVAWRTAGPVPDPEPTLRQVLADLLAME
ncbi:aromatic-ring hydroxylase C-terminal domain-containing protein, partial [Streptomyces sp. NPDC002920]